MPGDVDADLVHRLHGEGVELARPHSDGVDVDPMAEQMLENALRHRRTYRVLGTGEQHGGGHRRMCSTQISVNRRRAVFLSISTLSARRSRSSSAPSLCRPRRPMSMASIRLGVSALMLAIAAEHRADAPIVTRDFLDDHMYVSGLHLADLDHDRGQA